MNELCAAALLGSWWSKHLFWQHFYFPSVRRSEGSSFVIWSNLVVVTFRGLIQF